MKGPRVSVVARCYLTLDLAARGEFAEGARWGEQGVRMAEASDEQRERYSSSLFLGSLYLTQGALPSAVSWLERTVPFWESGEFAINLPRAMSALGLAWARAGRLTEGLPLLEKAIAQGVSMSLVYDHALRLASLAEGYLLADRLQEGERVAGEGLESARAHGQRGNEARIALVLGEIASRRTPLLAAQAEAHYRQALAVAETLGMRPTAARCRLGLGCLLRRAGAADRARAELDQAVGELRAMGMTHWLTRAEAELRHWAWSDAPPKQAHLARQPRTIATTLPDVIP